MMKSQWGILFLLVLLLAACDESADVSSQASLSAQRNADSAQLAMGKKVYRDNCASCHGVNAEGDANWRKRDAQGNFPPPPLNGSGHAWHHSLLVLKSVVQDGSSGGKGNMPAWRDKLKESEIDAVLAWSQSLWPQAIYDAWLEMQQRGQ